MGLNLLFHGGKCCAIKTLYGFSYDFYDNPLETLCDPLSAFGRDDLDKHGNHVTSSQPFFNEDAPLESYLKRLDRLIEYCKKHRPRGIIEATLVNSQKHWFPVLEELGFTLSCKANNSNSGNDVYVYHLCYPKDKAEKKAKPAPWASPVQEA